MPSVKKIGKPFDALAVFLDRCRQFADCKVTVRIVKELINFRRDVFHSFFPVYSMPPLLKIQNSLPGRSLAEDWWTPRLLQLHPQPFADSELFVVAILLGVLGLFKFR